MVQKVRNKQYQVPWKAPPYLILITKDNKTGCISYITTTANVSSNYNYNNTVMLFETWTV